MHHSTFQSRRVAVKSSIFGALAVSLPSISFAQEVHGLPGEKEPPAKLFHRYPAIDDAVVAEVVGASHFDLERVKAFVIKRPELARATWDWGFGDWETAIGAASHVGRRDIVEFLMSQGARPDIFTFAMLGDDSAVRSMVESHPDLPMIAGPHGISLLQHAKNGLRSDALTEQQRTKSAELVQYLEASNKAVDGAFLPLSEAEQAKYLGDYKYGDGEVDGFSIKLNLRKQLSLGRIGSFGGALNQIRKNTFLYNGCPSVEISFQLENERVLSMTVSEPELTLTANKN